jgi:hypothetical protein
MRVLFSAESLYNIYNMLEWLICELVYKQYWSILYMYNR